MTYNRSVGVAKFAVIEHVAELILAIGIPTNLEQLGMQADRIEWTATQALSIGRLIDNNPRPIDAAAMNRLVRAAYSGDRALAQ